MAQIHDEDSFYIVSPGGAIGFCEEEDIDWLFIPLDINEELPLSLEPETQINFCAQCGSPVMPGTRFCGACGAKLC